MTAELLMIVPSRGRPQNVRALLEAWCETATGAADVLIALDDDDPTWNEYKYKGWMLPGWPEGSERPLRWTMKERLRLGGTLNHVAHKMTYRYSSPYRAVGFMGDDHLPRTKGWDQRFMEALDDMGTGMVYGNDLLQRQNLPTHIAMTADIVRELGYMVPGGLVHQFIGYAWQTLGASIDRLRYLPDAVIEHMHPNAGKAEMDAGYEAAGSQYEEDYRRCEDWKRLQMGADVARLQELIRRG